HHYTPLHALTPCFSVLKTTLLFCNRHGLQDTCSPLKLLARMSKETDCSTSYILTGFFLFFQSVASGTPRHPSLARRCPNQWSLHQTLCRCRRQSRIISKSGGCCVSA